MKTAQWLILFLLFLSAGAAQLNAESVTLRIVDSDSGEMIPCRIHLKDSAGQPIKPEGAPFFRDHFVCRGEMDLKLAPGNYAYEIERGPEYELVTDHLKVLEKGEQRVTITLKRVVNLASEGWWSGELHVHRPLSDVPLLMQAEDLHVAPVITWWNNQNYWAERAIPAERLVRFDSTRFYHVMGGEDEREGGALLYFNRAAPLEIAGAKREFPSPMQFLEAARRETGVWIDIEKPFWWDVPIWLASGQVDSIGLANNHMCRDQMYESEAWGKPRDVARWPAPRGNGFWTQEIYYQILNTGLRIPPSAGSASGVLPNPVGYNRVYVHVGSELTYEGWWRGLKAGRSFVSNGPLLRVKAHGQWPGHIFKGAAGEELEIHLEAALTLRQPRGNRDNTAKEQQQNRNPSGGLGTIRFRESGWFLVRVITDNPKTFRFASTAPFYVEMQNQPVRISKSSTQFFLDWVRERKGRVKVEDAAQKEAVLRYHDAAERFWRDRLAQANAE
jgi:hypothetical protein